MAYGSPTSAFLNFVLIKEETIPSALVGVAREQRRVGSPTSAFLNFVLIKEETILSEEYAEFLTVTCLEWKHGLKDDRFNPDYALENFNHPPPLLVLRVGKGA